MLIYMKWNYNLSKEIEQHKEQYLEFLLNFISENKIARFNEIIENRTRHITVVLEDIFQPHNASAVLRSCDCFGIQDVHIIENKNEYNVNPQIALGSSKWLHLAKYNQKENNTLDCINQLKKDGYKIIATCPSENDCMLENLNVDNKFALLFGTELNGLSDLALENADEFVKIPMYGFTESFNISVSAALCLFHLSEKVRNSEVNWKLTEDEKIKTKINWVKNAVNNSEMLDNEFVRKISS